MQNVAESKAPVVLLLVTGREKKEAVLRSGIVPELQMKAETRNCDEKCEYEKVS
jgi:hypothetical protein